jgi:ABC-type multidrug transport system ATPase subunit
MFQLLSSPQILICDEPTTGLDSYNAWLVIDILKKLTICGKVVICSVHQPSTDIFKEFSSLMLMAEGKLLFHGSPDDCEELFNRYVVILFKMLKKHLITVIIVLFVITLLMSPLLGRT